EPSPTTTAGPATRRPRPAPLLQIPARPAGDSPCLASLRGGNPGHREMFDFARVPFGGRKSHGKPFQGAVNFFESEVPPDMDTSGSRVYRCDANPAIRDQLI